MYKLELTAIFATLQAVSLFPQRLKTAFRRSRRKAVLLVGGTAPKPLFAEFHSAATHRSGAFFSTPGGDFLKTAKLAYQRNRKLSRDRERHFSKSVRLAEPQPDQRSGLFKGFGIFPNKQNLRFPALPGTVVLSVCIYRRPACHIAHHHSLRPPSAKFLQRH